MLRILVATAAFGIALVAAAEVENYEGAATETIMIPMRDGTRLATDVYRPARAGKPVGGKFPVLVTRSPYNKSGEKSKGLFFARHGYVWVAQDCRGFFASQGRPTPFLREGEDGYDTIEWAAAQPWSNGKIATTGASYLAMNQFAAAIEAPPHLLAMYAAVGSANFYEDSAWRGGIPSLGWAVWLLNSTGQRDLASKPEAWLTLPREKRAEALANFPEQKQAYWELYQHPEFDSYWKQKGFWPAGYYNRMKDVPMFLLSGWYDGFCDANLHHFRALSQSQHTVKKLVIGPWPHGYGKGECGDAFFGRDGELDERSLQLDWFDHWLKGSSLKVVDPAPVRYYRIGGADDRTDAGKLRPGGEWHTSSTWPLPGTHPVLYYIHAGGRLDPARPKEEPASTLVHDPANPVPTIGGRQGNSCIQDQRPLEKRADVLTFVSAALTTPLDVTGTPRAGFWVESDAPEADFILRVADIYPDGYAAIISEGQVRVRAAGEVAIPLTAISKLVAPGHRIGLLVMSSSFPKFEPLPTRSLNTVYHDDKHSSWLELPIVPATR